jgi:hypothetical protein
MLHQELGMRVLELWTWNLHQCMTQKRGFDKLSGLRKEGPSVASGMLAQKNHLVFSILLHLIYLIIDDDGLVNQMLEIRVVGVEQLKPDIVIEILEKRILLLLIGVNVNGGIPQQLNELIQVFIHHHTSLVSVREFLLLELDSAAGHIVSPETSLELIPLDSLDVGVGVMVSLPLVFCGSKQLVCYEKDIHTVGTVGYLQLLLD